MATKRILLVRHGAYEDGALTGLGRRQARYTARRLVDEPITAIHCSTLPRAVETAEIISESFPDLPLRRAHILRECIPSAPARLSDWLRQVPRDRIRQGSLSADRAYRRYIRPGRSRDQCELLVCHGNLIRYLVSRAVGMGRTAWHTLGTHNCGMSELKVVSRKRILLISYNDVGHIPFHLRSG